MSTVHEERRQPDAEPKRIVLRRRQWESPDKAPVEVDLIERRYYTKPEADEWEVYLPDGTWIGSVGRYTGSIDTKIKGTRLRREGVRRTLWSYNLPGSTPRWMYGQVSRADCIRDLIRNHEYRQRSAQ